MLSVLLSLCACALAVAAILPLTLDGMHSENGPSSSDSIHEQNTLSADNSHAANSATPTDDGNAESPATGSGSEDANASIPDSRSLGESGKAPATGGTTTSSVPAITDIPEESIPHISFEHESETVLAHISPNASIDDVNAALAQADGILAQQVTPADMERGYVKLHTASGVSPEQALAQLRQTPTIRNAQPNYLYHRSDDSSDDATDAFSFIAQDLSTDDDKDLVWDQWALNSVNAFEAWGLAKVQDANSTRSMVTVAVIDDGFFVDHDDLKNNIVATYNAVEAGKDGDERGDIKDVSPTFGSHGTHVAGVIAAEANNGTGVAGVSYNAKLLVMQVFKKNSYGSSSASSDDIARAYQYLLSESTEDVNGNGEKETVAKEYNVRVANMSLGLAAVGDKFELDEDDELLIENVGKAHDAGILTVCSAGNEADRYDGAYNNYPCDWLEAEVGVIALQEGPPASRVYYSNYNKAGKSTKDLAAPGQSIMSTVVSTEADGTKKSGYGKKSGTSMAAPCVAGIAALVFSVNNALDADQGAQVLCSTANDLGKEGWDSEYGHGEVNAARAVAQATASVYLEGDKSLFATQPANDTDNGGDPLSTENATANEHTTTKLIPSIEGNWSWQSSDERVAVVGSDGTVTSKSPGTAVITATCTRESPDSPGSYETLIGTKTITVYDISFSGPDEVEVFSTIELSFNEEPNTGRWILDVTDHSVAELHVTSSSGKTTIKGLSVGEVYATADLSSGNGLSRTHHITVVPASIDDGNLHLTVSGLDNLVYTGAAVEPTPRIMCGNYELVRGVDYDITSYNNNTSITNNASLTIEGKGNFTGTRTFGFAIAKPNLSMARVSLPGWTYDGTVHTPKVTVTIGKQTLRENLYRVTYSGNRDVGTCTATVETANTSYCTGRAKGSCKVEPCPISSATVSSMKSRTYTGKKHTPKPKVTVGTKTLANGTDYTLSYRNNVNAGKATVVISGKGNYTGTKTATFTITKASNPMTVKAKTKAVKYSKLKKRKRSVLGCISFTANAQGRVTYTKVAKGSSKKLSIDKNTGAITVKKGTKKGLYKIRVKVTDSGGTNHSAKTQIVTAKVRVK